LILNNSRIEENILKKRTALTTAKSSVALLLFTLPLSSNLAYSAPSTTGEGNIVTGDHGVATGYNNAVTAKYGLAQGNDSVATGGNISREEFKAILEKEKQTFADKSMANDDLSKINIKIEANNKTETELSKKIKKLEELISKYNNDKTNKIDSLNKDLNNKNKELDNLKKEFDEAQNKLGSILTSINSGDKLVWITFREQIKKLDFTKLTDSSEGTTGRQKLAEDLKKEVEKAYPNYSETLKKWGIDKYEGVINGYINAGTLFGANKVKIQKIIESRNQKYLLNFGTARDLGIYANPDVGIVPDLLEKVNSVDPITLTKEETIPNKMTNSFFSSDKQKRYVQYSTLLKIIDEENIISDLNKSYNLNNNKLDNNFDKPNNVANLVFYLPPLKNNQDNKDPVNHSNFLLTDHVYYDYNYNIGASGYEVEDKEQDKDSIFEHTGEGNIRITHKVEDTTKPLFYYYKTSKFFDDIFNSGEGAALTDKQAERLKEWVNRFYNDFYNLIDFNAPEDKWLFDKKDFINKLDIVEGFAKKISDFLDARNKEIESPTTENSEKRELLAREIAKEIHNPKNYYENIEFKFKESTKDLWNKYAEKTAKELTDWAKKLKLYGPYNEVVEGVTKEYEDAQKASDEAKIKFEKKKQEIADLTDKIKELKSSDSNNSEELRQTQDELTEKQAEKEQLEKERDEKEKELKKMEEKLTSILGKTGENSIAAGKESFASGTNSIAIGTKNEVTGNNSVAIGAGNKVASHNVIVLGNNVTVDAGFDGAVVLGNESAPSKPMPVESITIQGTTYRFAGTNPTSTVSVGAEGKERQITHVAAGRITSTSTDAINGSQLYSVVEAINQKVTQHNKMLKAGIAGSAAIAGLPQVRGNGKSMVSAGTGNFKGQNAIAVGYSRSSDNGKVLFRLSGSTNTQGDVVSSVGVGYEW
jgi:vtaA12